VVSYVFIDDIPLLHQSKVDLECTYLKFVLNHFSGPSYFYISLQLAFKST
jgi:hypothetical protein